MGVTISIGYPSRKPLVPGKRGPTALEKKVLNRILVGDGCCPSDGKWRTYRQAAERCKRLGLLENDDRTRSGYRLTTAGLDALRRKSLPP